MNTAEYHYHALFKGNPAQRMWHKKKFKKAVEMAQLKGGETILDLGCGAGTLRYFLPEDADVTFADKDHENINFTQQKFKGSKRIIIDVEKEPLPENTYNTIFLIETIEHIKDSDYALKNIRKSLKEEGVLIITTPNHDSAWKLIEPLWSKFTRINYVEQHIHKFTPRTFGDALIKNRLTCEEMNAVLLHCLLIARARKW